VVITVVVTVSVLLLQRVGFSRVGREVSLLLLRADVVGGGAGRGRIVRIGWRIRCIRGFELTVGNEWEGEGRW
jgi:hypothetical protein